MLYFLRLLKKKSLTFIAHLAKDASKNNQLSKENLLTTFIQHTPAAVAMFDTEMNYIAATEKWYKDYGLVGKNIIGKNYYNIYSDTYSDISPENKTQHTSWLEKHKRALKGKTIKVDEEQFIRRDGTIDWIKYESRAWYKHNGDQGGLIMLMENITHRKNREIMKNEFISNVNHELRTPLTSIQGSLGLLKIKCLENMNEKGQRLLNLSYDNCTRLTHLVNDILDMQKMASGKMEYNFESTPICSLIENILERHQSYADKYQVHLNFINHVDEVFCYIDNGRFNQVLVNLLSNATKFSPPGETVSVTVNFAGDYNKNNSQEKTSQDKVKISVSDNGVGIPEAFRNKIFEKFTQADNISTEAQSGTGLGLNITQSIIENFGGKITFESEEKKGTTFHFTLPLCDASHTFAKEA